MDAKERYSPRATMELDAEGDWVPLEELEEALVALDTSYKNRSDDMRVMRELHRCLEGAVAWLDNIQNAMEHDDIVEWMPNNVPGRDAMREALKEAEEIFAWEEDPNDDPSADAPPHGEDR